MTGILLGLLTAARLPGVLFVGLCGLEYLRSCDWRLSRVGARPLVWFALAPLGFLAFAAFLDIVTGDPLAMFHAYDRVSDWTYHDLDPNFLATILEEGRLALRALSGRGSFTERAFIDSVLPMVSLVVLLVASTRAIADRRAARPMLPLGIFGLASTVMFTLNSNVVSVHRYGLPMLVIYIVFVAFVAQAGGGRVVLTGFTLLGVGLQSNLYILFISSRFAG